MDMAQTTPSVASVAGPDGGRLRMEDLPAPDTKRWVQRRKAEVVCAVVGGLMSSAEACARWDLHPEELTGWVKTYNPKTNLHPLRSKRK